MKLRSLFLVVLFTFSISFPVFAGTRWYNAGNEIGNFSEVNCSSGLTCSNIGGKATITLSGSAGPLIQSTLVTNAVDVADSVWGISGGVRFEGATEDNFEAVLQPLTDPTADVTLRFPSLASGNLFVSTMATNDIDVANSVWASSNAIRYEGATEDAFETTLSAADVGADITVTLPSSASTLIGSSLATNNVDVANSVWGASDGVAYEGATADDFETTVSPTDPTADRAITLPNASGMLPVFQASFSASKMWVATDAVASGQTSKAVTVTGVSASSKCTASLAEVATNSIAIRAVVPTADTVTVTVSGDPGASNADIAVLCAE